MLAPKTFAAWGRCVSRFFVISIYKSHNLTCIKQLCFMKACDRSRDMDGEKGLNGERMEAASDQQPGSELGLKRLAPEVVLENKCGPPTPERSDGWASYAGVCFWECRPTERRLLLCSV